MFKEIKEVKEAEGGRPSGLVEMDEVFFERVYEQVARVPAGTVCTYGTIAELAGYPRASREVGFAMSRALSEWDLPYHRIVNAKGPLAPSHAIGGKDTPRQMLEGEGVTFVAAETIDMKKHRWPPEPDSGESEPEQLSLL